MADNQSKLDANQVLKASYDDVKQSLRVLAEVQATVGNMDVEIDAADGDNIAISDGTNTAVVNPDGSLNVTLAGPVEVELSASSGDSIKISDGTDELQVNSDGSINVNVVASVSGGPNNYYDEVTGIAMGITATIITYSPTSYSRIKRIAVSGTNLATYELYKNAVLADKIRTTVADLNSSFIFSDGLVADVGDTIEVKVYHNRPDPGDFNARIEVFEE